MSNRHQRRTEIAAFKREACAVLLTYLIDADAPLDRHPLLRNALAFWRAGVKQRRPFCPACRASFADDAGPGGFLFSTPAITPTSASVSAFCTECWNDLPAAEIERIAARVLQRLMPSGRFL